MERSKVSTKQKSPNGLSLPNQNTILINIIWYYFIIIIIIIKKDWQCKAGRGRLTPYQSEDRSPTLPAHRGKEGKGKILEDKKGESN